MRSSTRNCGGRRRWRRRRSSRAPTLIAALMAALLAAGWPSALAAEELKMTGGWKVQDAASVSAPAAVISQSGFDDSHWIPAIVPGTVFTSYLNAERTPDPLFGGNASKTPDPFVGEQRFQIDDAFFTNNDFWYRTEFAVPPGPAGGRVWMNFDGINWKAEVFVNGQAVGRIDGAFIRAHFDITRLVKAGQVNCAAVLIHKVSHPGKVKTKSLTHWEPNGGELGLDSPTFLASIGWNWLPTIPGREIGIWNDVWLKTTGDVTIADPFVTSELPDFSRAVLHVQADLVNHADEPRQGVLSGTIGEVQFSRTLSLAAGQTLRVVQPIMVANPRLWWPNGMGEQAMYQLSLRCDVGGVASDGASVPFGIRTLTYEVRSGVLFVSVNGHRVLIRGGNWGMDEGLLRCDAAGYDTRVRLHQQMNFNMIRNWVGMTGKDAFYDACDKYGILVWDDFWLANPVDGPDPEDQAMFMANARDKILRVRNHPCLAIYCGRNEGEPPKEIDAGLRAATRELDGTRYYLSNSAAPPVSGHGPYEVQSPRWYFENRGETLHSELGIVAVPPVESLRQMLPADRVWPINDLWGQHDLSQERGPAYLKRLGDCYGAASGVEDFCRKAQLLNLESAKAMLEAWQSRQGSGCLIWMTQAAWPSMICQAYAYDFEPTGAYFGFRKACEPVHILWDRAGNRIVAANDTVADLDGLTAEAEIYGLDGVQLWRRSMKLRVPAGSAVECFGLEVPGTVSEVYFVQMRLLQAGKVLSDNFYWAGKTEDRYQALAELKPVSLEGQGRLSQADSTTTITATLKNAGPGVAFAIRLKVMAEPSGGRVLPAFYEDNYFSLLPGESRTVKISFESALLKAQQAGLGVEGWNIAAATIPMH
jgi:hypothetical protein